MTVHDLPNGFQAVQFVNANFDEIEQFVGGDAEFRNRQLVVAGPDGPIHANNTDWIIGSYDGRSYFVLTDADFKARPQ